MATRALIIDAEARAKADCIIAYAEEHHYKPGPGVPPPGDDPNHWAMFNTYRVVFSITESDNVMWRHLSVSVPGGKLPNPYATYSLAEMFGFTDWDGRSYKPPLSWLMKVEKRPVPCIVLAQAMPAREPIHANQHPRAYRSR